MSDYSKISTNQLDIEAISDYVVESRNLVYRNGEIDSSSNKAMDVDKVAGINAEMTAIAVSKEDRHTVENTLKLGGKDASEYITQNVGNSIMSNQINMKKTYGNELQSIKDELYQLRNELIKGGSIANSGQYNGFIDSFKRNHYVNLQDKLGDVDTYSVNENNKVHVSDLSLYNSLEVYDFICLYNEVANTFDVKEIIDKDDESRVIVLDSDIRAIVKDNELAVYKSNGFIYNGMYAFANSAENSISDQEYHTGLSDDTFNLIQRINESGKGFGYSFRIPEAKQGYLTSFEICAKATGNPGALMCYIIDARDFDKFINPKLAADDYAEALEKEDPNGFKFFAKSQPYFLDSSLGKRYIQFNFLQDNSTYPLMSRDSENASVRYIAIVEATQADASNYIDIVFLQHKNSNGEYGDLELNNTTYYYSAQSDDSTVKPLNTDEDINKKDMYYQITTRGVTEKEPEAQRQGLYTAKYKFDATKDINAAKARLVLRIKTEGKYAAATNELIPKVYSGNALTLTDTDKKDGVSTVDDLRLKTEIYKRLRARTKDSEISEVTNTIVGNNITKVAGVNDSTITCESPVLVSNGDKVYRCAYLVNLKARKIYMDENGIVKETSYDNYMMPLVDVYKDLDNKNGFSDRLVFETDLVGKDLQVKGYNDFELQIYWENRELSMYSKTKNSQMGAIRDLVLTFNQNF